MMEGFSKSDIFRGCQKSKALKDEFGTKLSYDFSRYIFLGLRPDSSKHLQGVINQAMSKVGYEAHRLIEFKMRTIHIYIRYANKSNAYLAVKYFKNDPAFIAETVSDLLGSLYVIEMTCRRIQSWTRAIVDINGSVEHTNPLEKDVVMSLLLKFGDPRFFSYQVSNNGKVDHVQVQFSSMAEALGASIGHGLWQRKYGLESLKFHYRVRIMPSEKEMELLKSCGSASGGDNSDAFGLEYFFNNEESKDDYKYSKSYKITSEEATFRKLCNYSSSKYRNSRGQGCARHRHCSKVNFHEVACSFSQKRYRGCKFGTSANAVRKWQLNS